MGKAIGLFGCTAVAAAALWLTNARQPVSTASAQEEFDPQTGVPMLGSGPRTSASELLERGTALYVAGRHAEAIQALEAAREQQQHLTQMQRRRLAEYLQLAKNELRRASAPQPAGHELATARPDAGSGDAGHGEADSGDAARGRVNEYMRRAYLEHKAGNSLQAIRWAATADSVAHSSDVAFAPGQETPNDFIARVRGAGGPAPNAAGIPFERSQPDLATAQASAAVAQTPGVEAGPDSSYPMSPEGREARRLMAEARAALNAGRYEDARTLAQQAGEREATFTLFEETPEQLLADVERSTGLIKFPRGGSSAAHPLVQAPGALEPSTPSTIAPRGDVPAMLDPRHDASLASSGTLPEIHPSAGPDAHHAQAQELLRLARQDIAQGQFESARARAAAAERLNVVYQAFDDRPELVVQDAERLSRQAAPLARRDGQPGIEQFTQPGQQNLAFEERPIRPLPAAPDGGGFEGPPFAQEDVQPVVGTNDPRWQTPVRTSAADYGPADVGVVRPRGPSAAELFNQGLLHLRQGRNDLAYESFLNAYNSGQQLDPHRTQQLQDFLRDLRPRRPQQFADGGEAGGPLAVAGASGEPNPLHAVEQQRAIQYDRLRTETLNAIFKADRLREKDSQQALETIDRATASIGSSELDEETIAPLLSQLRRTRESIEAWQNQRAPIINLEKRNSETLEIVHRERETMIRVEQEIAALVDQFNELFNQRRYAEAEVVAKQARDLDPENPVTEVLFWKARFARRHDSNKQLIEDKEEGVWEMLNQAEIAAIPENRDFSFGKDWADINQRRKGRYGPDTRIRTEQEQQIEQSLSRRISLNFEKAPLSEVLKHIAAIADVNVALDKQGLEEEGVSTDQEVNIHVDGIMLKSALNLMLKPLNLGYAIEDEVLKVTSRMRQQGQLQVRNYTVADLVSPIPNFTPGSAAGMTSSGTAHNGFSNFGMSGPPPAPPIGGAQFQVQDPAIPGAPVHNAWGAAGRNAEAGGNGMAVDFDTLMELIVSTIEPDSWAEMGGPGSVRPFETTLSLVIRQTGAVHEEIADLLQQLRRLQDLQVTIEVRFISVADRFFEAIGVDFDFDVQDNVDGDDVFPVPGFGTPGGTGVTGDPDFDGESDPTEQGQFFNPIPGLFLQDLDDWPKTGTVVGLADSQEFTPDLDVSFQQGSFNIGVPDFGNFDATAGMQVGMAILSDIEAFFFIRAAQADERTNIMFAPKVTLFNGQTATVTDAVQRPFVTSLVPTVGFFAVGFTPQITVLQEGVSMTVLAVISADRRFVRLTVIPFFSSITDVFTFSFVSQGQQGAVQGQGQGAQVGQGGFQPIAGFGGIGGGEMARNALMLALPSQVQGQGQQQAGQQQQAAAVGNVTIQQPVLEFVSVTTTVSVPDGGTVLLGGVKRLREGRNMAGVPILNKLPYISRLFKNTGVGRDTESLMLMVTPRIIIQEEEEELLGIPIQ